MVEPSQEDEDHEDESGDTRTGEFAGISRPVEAPFGLARKIILFVPRCRPLGAVSWTLSVWAIRRADRRVHLERNGDRDRPRQLRRRSHPRP